MKPSEIVKDRKYVGAFRDYEIVREVTDISNGSVYFVWNRTVGHEIIPVRGVLSRWEFADWAIRELGAGVILDGDG